MAGGPWLKDEAEEEYVRVKYVLLVLDGIKRRCVALVWLASIWRVSDDGLHLRPGKEKCGGSQGNPLSPSSANGFKSCLLPLTSIMDTTRTQYSGLSRKLIVALDIGTTFSGAAYVLLDPGEIPQIQSVMRRVIPLVSDPGTTVTN